MSKCQSNHFRIIRFLAQHIRAIQSSWNDEFIRPFPNGISHFQIENQAISKCSWVALLYWIHFVWFLWETTQSTQRGINGFKREYLQLTYCQSIWRQNVALYSSAHCQIDAHLLPSSTSFIFSISVYFSNQFECQCRDVRIERVYEWQSHTRRYCSCKNINFKISLFII